MIIDVTGFGWSGSGAYIDLLREYDNVQIAGNNPEWEFYLLHWVDGLKDLEYKLMEKNCRVYDSDVAIKRFLKAAKRSSRRMSPFNGKFISLCQQYIDSLEGRHFKLLKTSSDRLYFNNTELLCFCYNKLIEHLFCNKYMKRIIKRSLVENIEINRIHSKHLIYHPTNFWDSTHNFTGQLLSYLREGKNMPLVTNHLFSPDCPQLFFNLIAEDLRCLVIRRDPRDTYILAKELKKEGISAVPSDNVDDFIWFYKKTIQETRVEHPQVLSLYFEDLIYDYEKTIAKIEKFTGLTKHTNPHQYFQPSISINNTQLFKKITRYDNDIKKIEIELAESLYEFSRYSICPDFSTNLF